MVTIDIASSFFDHEPRYKLLFANEWRIKKTKHKHVNNPKMSKALQKNLSSGRKQRAPLDKSLTSRVTPEHRNKHIHSHPREHAFKIILHQLQNKRRGNIISNATLTRHGIPEQQRQVPWSAFNPLPPFRRIRDKRRSLLSGTASHTPSA